MEMEIRNICKTVCCRDIEMEDELFSLGLLDSYSLLELISILEEKFNIEISADEISELDNFSSLKNIILFIQKKLSR